MATLLRTGTLVVSIDLNAAERGPLLSIGSVVQTHRALIDLLQAAEAPATWCLAAPGDWKAAASLLERDTPQELAILADDAWTKASAGRERFVRELQLHQAAAQRTGYHPSTLALAAGNIAPYADLAQKQGITAVRGATEVAPLASGISALFDQLIGAADGDRAYRPTAVRFGVWDLRPSAVWPHAKQATASRIPLGPLKRGVEKAIADQSVFHLRLDAAAVTAAGEPVLRGLHKFFAHVHRRVRQTRLAVMTMQQLATRLSSPRVTTTARSILSRAA